MTCIRPTADDPVVTSAFPFDDPMTVPIRRPPRRVTTVTGVVGAGAPGSEESPT